MYICLCYTYAGLLESIRCVVLTTPEPQRRSTLMSKLSTQKYVGMISSATGSMGRTLSSFDCFIDNSARAVSISRFWVADTMSEFVNNLIQ